MHTQANTLRQPVGGVSGAAEATVVSSGSKPLDDDNFLKGFWGGH